MKILLLNTLFIMISLGCMSQPTSKEIIEGALKEAHGQNKNIILVFTASWCHSCREFKDSVLNDITENGIGRVFKEGYIVKYMNVYEHDDRKNLETPGAKEFLSAIINGNDISLPFYIIVNKDNLILGDSFMKKIEGGCVIERTNIGRPFYKNEIEAFIQLLKMTSNLNGENADKIRKRLLGK